MNPCSLDDCSLSQVCCDWREIALTMRDRVFEEHEEQLIDIYDVKVNLLNKCVYKNL